MADDRLLLGIDVGTSSSKGVLVDLYGQIVAQHTTQHGFDIPRPGWAEHDADAVWWHDFCEISNALIQKSGVQPERIAGVGCSAIAPTMLPLDGQYKPLRPAILYGIDTRAGLEIQEMTAELGEEAIFEKTGQFLSAQSVGPKVLWYKRNQPELFQQTRKIVTATTYLVYRLTERFVVDNYVAPYFTPFFDVNKLEWDQDTVEKICPVEWLPETMWSIEAAGTITQQAHKETGIPIGTPVAVGTADAASEAIAASVVEPGDLMVMYGTTMFLIQTTAQYRPHRDLWASVHVQPGQAVLAAGMSTSGALLRWFVEEFAQSRGDEEMERAFARLEQDAKQISAGSDGLVTLPYLSGERTPINDVRARGVIFGLTLKHTQAHVFRSCLEGIAFGLRHNIEVMGEVGAVPQRLVAIGGGVKNALWLQICSDVTGMTQEVPAQTIGAAFGDAYIAGYAAGIFNDSTVLRDAWVQVDRVIEPNPENKSTYDALYPIYRDLYSDTRKHMHQLSTQFK